MFSIVVIKFIAPAIDPAPAKCKLNIARSTESPLCEILSDSGGYTVHPVPTPLSTRLDTKRSVSENGNIQKLKLLSLGKAISGDPTNIGTNQLPKAPINIGITIKKIIIKACAVIITLYSCVFPNKN